MTGGQISDGKARLDFDVPGATLDKDEITTKLNALIQADQQILRLGPLGLATVGLGSQGSILLVAELDDLPV